MHPCVVPVPSPSMHRAQTKQYGAPARVPIVSPGSCTRAMHPRIVPVPIPGSGTHHRHPCTGQNQSVLSPGS
eukprot:8979717-Karenia_brevis.AAC.1